MPDAFLRGLGELDLPPLGLVRRRRVLPAAGATRARAELEAAARGDRRGGGPGGARLARRSRRRRHVGSHARALRARASGSSSSRRRRELAADRDAFERKLYVIRRVAEHAAGPDLVVPSFSSKTLVYKGMLTAPQLGRYYPDLADDAFASALALVHSRFSTNTFPSWELAHPYRMIAHNGEINTLRGNVNWMRARESQLASELFGDDLQKVLPVVRPGGSDTAVLDNVLELLVLAGRSLPHALMMMIPEAYAGRADVSDELRGFYAFHECLTEAWDGPAAIAFTDGRVIGATLDRNGLRPGRWLETRDGWVVLASETGRARHPRRRTSCARAACSPASSSSSTSSRGGSSRTRRSSARSRRGSRTPSGSSASTCASPTCRAASPSAPRASRCAACSSRSATRRRT